MVSSVYLRLCAWALLALLIGTLFGAAPVSARSLLILSAAPMQAGKYEAIAPLAQAAGIEMEYRFIDRPGTELRPDDLSGHDLVVIDAPFGSALGTAQSKLAPLLPAVSAPWIWMQSNRALSNGVDEETAARLHRYFINGGRANFTGFLCQMNQSLFHTGGSSCAEAMVFPESGLYHPGYGPRIFATPEAYLSWKGIDPAKSPPVIGLLIHRTHIDSEVTGFIDDLIHRIEAAGAVPLAVYVSPMANGEITRLMSVAGKPIASVIVNTQIVLNPEGRKAEFEALGLPVIQAMPYRKGEQTDWEKDPVGIATQDIPFYLSQPEYTGIADPLIASVNRASDGAILPIERQAKAAIDKALRLVRLQRLPAADKKVALFFYNYPAGEKNLGASFLNVPQSLETVLAAMQEAGYRVTPRTSDQLIEQMTAMLRPYYRDGEAEALLQQGLAAKLPVARYKAWFDSLPETVRRPILDRWGQPEQSGMVVRHLFERSFVIPRLLLGNLTILPQPPRGERLDDREKALYHDTKAPPSHAYLAAYLWARDQFRADALIHFGTHGTQEWQPGKERGLAVEDFPYLVLGDLPVLYPYIVDNIGEALQTKRRGRAVTISHATPSFGPAGLHGDITRLHDLLHTWLSMDEGEVRAKTAAEIRAQASRLTLDKDMGLTPEAIERDFRHFVDALHTHLHELALAQQPIGLAHFGQPAAPDDRLFTVMQMLGKPLLTALNPADPEESVVGDYTKLKQTAAWALLDRHVRRGEPYQGKQAIADLIEKGRGYWSALSAPREIESLLAGLSGRLIPTSYGGDPIRNPDSLPTGRNLYGFDPSRVPTREAWEAGREAAEKLIAQHRDSTGQFPDKLAFTLWSVETMRHFGVLEAQAMAVMGVRPKWDQGGRVIGIEVIPAAELKRPRVDAVISVTGLYRDHFPNLMKWLAEAAAQTSRLNEPGNPIAAHTNAVEATLRGQGVAADEAGRLAQTRVFSSESGAYGTGLDGATLASDSWGTGADGKENRAEGERKLAGLYLDRMQFAYGPDESHWGEKPPVNAFAEHLKGVKGAVLSRSSNLYGMLTTDDPFQYLGGISLAVRHLSGQSPALYISNLREAGRPRTETAAGFLARDLKSRYLHPGWIEKVQKEGYSGAIEILDSVNNLWGWQATAPETVRDDQWAEFKAVYVDDKYKLGVNEWFEKTHPQAQAQMIERMLEAVRKDYWHAESQTVADLARRWQDLASRHDIVSDNAKFTEFVAQAAGYGLSAQPASPAQQPQAAAAAAPTQTVSGQKLEKQPDSSPVPLDWTALLSALVIMSALVGGLVRQARRSQPGLSLSSLSHGA